MDSSMHELKGPMKKSNSTPKNRNSGHTVVAAVKSYTNNVLLSADQFTPPYQNFIDSSPDLKRHATVHFSNQRRISGGNLNESNMIDRSNPFRRASLVPSTPQVPLPTDFELRVLKEHTYQNVIINTENEWATKDFCELVRLVSDF